MGTRTSAADLRAAAASHGCTALNAARLAITFLLSLWWTGPGSGRQDDNGREILFSFGLWPGHTTAVSDLAELV